ncbi:MAG: aminotransferase class III-fold pyridoxal phosphate-dependent enzyme [Streptosporangiaceae bacterium]
MAMDQATPLDAAAVSTDAGQLIQQTPAAEPGLARPRAGQPLSGQSRPVSTQHVAARPAASAQHRPQPPTAGSSRQNGRPSSGDEERARLRLAGIIDEQEEIFVRRQPESLRLAGRASGSLAGGVTSSWQITRPQPVWLSHGQGSRIYDVDGNEYVDLHGGYGAALAGHGHPAIVEAVRSQVGLGTHFAQPTRTAIAVAEELSRRFGLPQWRFANSGTEATMDAVHLMRAITGRDLIIKVEGCYHGHHDSVQVSVCPEADDIGPADRPLSVPSSTGIPKAITDLTLVVGFNDLVAVKRVLEENPGQVAGMIVEPIMMNAGIILPEPGYLAGLADLLHAHGSLLAFDEVKTGLTAGPGGATGLTGVTPDIVCLAKAIGGGVSVAAIGGTAAVMSHVASGDYEMVGTFNGNPLAMAACRAMLCSVATPDAYDRLERLRLRAVEGVQRAIDQNGLQARVVSVGAKGCVVFSAEPVRDFRDFLGVDDQYSQAHWLFQHNGGVFLPPWGKSEQWLISVQHDETDIDLFVDNFAAFAAAVGG